MTHPCALLTRPVVVALLALALGCDTLAELRRQIKGAPPDAVAGLRVEVEPPDGISILLDGVRVASVSPFESAELTPGPHEIEVRAMGYHSVSLPVVLTAGKRVTVPVALRARPPDPEPKPRERRPPEKSPEPPPAPAPRVPHGVEPINLTLAINPTAPIMLDGTQSIGREITLERVSGEISAGELTLGYRLGGADLLTLTPKDDGCSWSKDGQPLAAGQSFKLHRGVTKLERVTESGTVQRLIVRR